jgi:hypothetical protein
MKGTLATFFFPSGAPTFPFVDSLAIGLINSKDPPSAQFGEIRFDTLGKQIWSLSPSLPPFIIIQD